MAEVVLDKTTLRISQIGQTKPSVAIGGEGSKFVPNINHSFAFESSTEKFWWNVNAKDVLVVGEKATYNPTSREISLTVGSVEERYRVEIVDGEEVLKWYRVFASHPGTNVWTHELQFAPGVEFCYQGPLDDLNKLGQRCRPLEVVGSYAVYCSGKGHHKDRDGNTIVNYRAGKMGHIYPPWFTDADGKKKRSELYIDAKTGTYRITIDAAWFAAARFPVVANDTFGYTTAGGTGQDVENGNTEFGEFDATAPAGTLTNVSWYLSTYGTDGPIQYGLYSNVSDLPNTRLTMDASTWSRGTSEEWKTNPVAWSYEMTEGTRYWPSVNPTTTEWITSYYDDSGSKDMVQCSPKQDTPAGPIDSADLFAAQTSKHVSVYGIYTPGGSSDDLTGDDLAAGTPTLETPSIGQKHALTGSDLGSSAPTLDSSAMAQEHALGGDDLTSGTPALDTPTVGHIHDLVGDDLSDAAPTLDTPDLAQVHALAGTDLAATAPTLDTSDLAQAHILTGDDLAASAPTLDASGVGQVHALTADDLAATAPGLDTPDIGESNLLTGDDLASSAPTLDTATIGQVHALTASDITATPTLDTPDLGQVHGLTADELTSSAPALDTPTVAEGVDNLTGADLAASTPTLDTATIGQVHVLTGTGLTATAPTLDASTIAQTQALNGDEVAAGTPTLDTPTLAIAADALIADDLVLPAPITDTPILRQIHGLATTGVLLGSPLLDTPILVINKAPDWLRFSREQNKTLAADVLANKQLTFEVRDNKTLTFWARE